MQELYGLRAGGFQNVALVLTPHTFVIQDYAGATVTSVHCVEVLRMAFWHDSGSSRRISQVDPWHWNPENN
eukprot:9185723-Pyramimonas_sp.AAC.1